ncbi:MAG: hypothetical protein HDT28_01585 [Clostridiales bacterium]|nr:hypothetical protein [Clostridiales bacterium]
MREENKLNRAIKQDGANTQADILDELRRRYPQYIDQSDSPKVSVRKKRVAVISAFAVVAVCAAIVVPCAVLLPNRDNGGNNDGDGNIRYCTQDEYSVVDDVEYTIGEYCEGNNFNFLYFDWYESGEDRYTSCYISNLDNEVLCLKERVYLPQSDEMVQLSITKSNVYLSIFDFNLDSCDKEHTVNNHVVKWSVDIEEAVCIFEDGGYRYFISIEQGQDENRLFELVAELLEKN